MFSVKFYVNTKTVLNNQPIFVYEVKWERNVGVPLIQLGNPKNFPHSIINRFSGDYLYWLFDLSVVCITVLILVMKTISLNFDLKYKYCGNTQILGAYTF